MRALEWEPGDWDLGLDADDNAALKREVWPEHGWGDDDEPLDAEDKPAEPLKLVAEPVKIAAGLKRCRKCREYKGTTSREEISNGSRFRDDPIEVLCLCDGAKCNRCRELIFRPSANHYFPLENKVQRTFRMETRCKPCEKAVRSFQDEVW